jgi:transketolase
LADVAKGAYVLKDCAGEPELILIATGSEVHLAMEAAEQLADKAIRVVSMPCAELYEAQSEDYKQSVLPSTVRKRIAIEAAHVDYWHKYTGFDGKIIGMRSFGASAPADQLFKEFGITTDAVVDTAKELLA